MPMKLQNYNEKQPILIFAPYSFLIFLDTLLHEPKLSEKTISENCNGVLVFFRRNITCSDEFCIQKIEGWVLIKFLVLQF